MNIGDRIPEMLGKDQDGREIKAADFRGCKLFSTPTRKTTHRAAPPRLAHCATTARSYGRRATRWLG